MRRYATDFLHGAYPGSSIEYDLENDGLFRIELNAQARDELGTFMETERPARSTRLAANSILATFDPSLTIPKKLRVEVIDVAHPLSLWMRKVRDLDRKEIVPAVAIDLRATVPGVEEGLYAFATDFWRIEGVRKQLTLQHALISVTTGTRIENDLAERVIDEAMQLGRRLDITAFSDVQDTLTNALAACEHLLENEYLAETGAFESENSNRVAQARELVTARANRKLEQLNATLSQQMLFRDERQRRVIPLTEAKIRNAEKERETQLARIARQGRVDASFRPVVGGVIVLSDG